MIGTPHDLYAHLQSQVNLLAGEILALKAWNGRLEQSIREIAMPEQPRGAEIETAEDQKRDKDWVPEAKPKKGSD